MAQFNRYKSIFGESKQISKQALSKKEAIIRSIKKSLREEEGMAQKDIESVVGKIEEVITDVIGQHGVDNSVVDALSNTVKDINSQNTIISDIDMMERQLSKRYASIFKEAEKDEPFGGKQAPPFDAEDAEEAREKKNESSIFKKFPKNFLNEEDEMEDEELEEGMDSEEDEEKMEERLTRRQRTIKEMRSKLSRKPLIKEEDDEDEESDDKMAAVRAAKEESRKRSSRFIEEDEAAEDEDEDEELEEDIYGFKPRFKEESETDEGDLIDDESGSDYDAMSLDAEGNYSSDRGMEAEDDDNASEDM
jgi:hypothetical protein